MRLIHWDIHEWANIKGKIVTFKSHKDNFFCWFGLSVHFSVSCAIFKVCSLNRIVLNARKYDHVSPLLKQLHWLPVSKRIMYKVALIVYKSIHSLTPQYISCLFSPVQQSRYSLRSRTDPHLLKIPYINLKKGEQNISFFWSYSLE